MADRNDPEHRRSNDPVTAPTGTDRRPRQSEANASRMSSEEAASRASATRSGRSAAKWFGAIIVAVVLIFLVAAFFGGGAWLWAPTPDTPQQELVD